jgi:hypothetical protein
MVADPSTEHKCGDSRKSHKNEGSGHGPGDVRWELQSIILGSRAWLAVANDCLRWSGQPEHFSRTYGQNCAWLRASSLIAGAPRSGVLGERIEPVGTSGFGSVRTRRSVRLDCSAVLVGQFRAGVR